MPIKCSALNHVDAKSLSEALQLLASSNEGMVLRYLDGNYVISLISNDDVDMACGSSPVEAINAAIEVVNSAMEDAEDAGDEVDAVDAWDEDDDF